MWIRRTDHFALADAQGKALVAATRRVRSSGAANVYPLRPRHRGGGRRAA